MFRRKAIASNSGFFLPPGRHLSIYSPNSSTQCNRQARGRDHLSNSLDPTVMSPRSMITGMGATHHLLRSTCSNCTTRHYRGKGVLAVIYSDAMPLKLLPRRQLAGGPPNPVGLSSSNAVPLQPSISHPSGNASSLSASKQLGLACRPHVNLHHVPSQMRRTRSGDIASYQR